MKSFVQFLREGKNAEAIDEVKNSIRASVDRRINEKTTALLNAFRFNEAKSEEDELSEEEYKELEEKIREMEDKEDDLTEEEEEELAALKEKVKAKKKRK